MAEITVPTIYAETASLGLQRAQNVTKLLSGKDVITIFPEARWALKIDLVDKVDDEALVWEAALAALSDLQNYFRAGPPGYTGAVYSGAIPVVDGAAQIGKSLNVRGAANSTQLFKRGEWFEVNGELKKVTADVTTDGTGDAVIPFEPALRGSPADGLALELAAPKASFRLTSPEYLGDYSAPVRRRFTVNCVEAVYAS